MGGKEEKNEKEKKEGTVLHRRMVRKRNLYPTLKSDWADDGLLFRTGGRGRSRQVEIFHRGKEKKKVLNP